MDDWWSCAGRQLVLCQRGLHLLTGDLDKKVQFFKQIYFQFNLFSSNNMSSSTPVHTLARVLDQPASLAGVLIDIGMIPALRSEETAVLRLKKSRNRLIDGDDTFRTLMPPSMIRETTWRRRSSPTRPICLSTPGCFEPWLMPFHGTAHHQQRFSSSLMLFASCLSVAIASYSTEPLGGEVRTEQNYTRTVPAQVLSRPCGGSIRVRLQPFITKRSKLQR